jgi:phosphoribosylanthranilate isomerase
VKICCISSLDEARIAIAHGASALGFVSAMPSGPGVIPEELIAEIVPRIPPPIGTFLLTSATTADEIIAQQHRTRANALQIVDRVADRELEILRRSLPGVSLVQVIHVVGAESVEEARSVEGLVDAILLDSGNASLKVKELGGTGRVHDWQLSRRIREQLSVPLFLAGGLREANVAQAVRAVSPFGLDVCSGVRTDGRLDEQKLKAFIRESRKEYLDEHI